MSSNVVYPLGCGEVDAGMHVDELIRKLKLLAAALQSMDQEEEEEENLYEEFVPLSLHLVDERFLNHPSRDVRMLIACCVSDILRIYAPQAPYQNPEHVKAIFEFFICQLEGLKEPKDEMFKRCVYLLENLTFVKSFNMCFELDDALGTFYCLVRLIFSIITDDQAPKVKWLLFDIIYSLLADCDSTTSNKLLDVILMNLVEPIKFSNKNAYNLTKEFITRRSEQLESRLQNFLHQVLTCGVKNEHEYQLVGPSKVYDLIFELNKICPSIPLSVYPQLEYKLKSLDEAERLGAVFLLARMFSNKQSIMATKHLRLWQAFLTRFNDVSVQIRTNCVQHSMHFLINQPELRNDIVKTLCVRQHDANQNVRLDVVKGIVATAKLDFTFVSNSEGLLNCLKERTMDKVWKIRKEALEGIAVIYKMHLEAMEKSEFGLEDFVYTTRLPWMSQKVLQGYNMDLLNGRILVERLFNTCLVPYQLKSRDRMEKLLYLYSTADNTVTNVIIDIQKHSSLVRRHVAELLKVIQSGETTENYSKRLNYWIGKVSKILPDAGKASEFIWEFCNILKDNVALMQTMETIIDPATDCTTGADSVATVLRKIGPPVMTNLVYITVKSLLERTTAVLIDKEAITNFLEIIKEVVMDNSNFCKMYNVATDVILDRSFHLMPFLASFFATHFDDENTLEELIILLSNKELTRNEHVTTSILSVLTSVGELRPMGQYHQNIMEMLMLYCQKVIVSGTPRQGKYIVRCLHANINTESTRTEIFAQVLDALRRKLDSSLYNSTYCTAIVALGHIALLMPEQFKSDMKTIISQKIVKELLVNPQRSPDDHLKNLDLWCEENDLPEITKCIVHGMKTTVRWLMGLKTDFKAAQKTFKMFTAFVETSGTFINAKVPFSDAEKAWLRLTAGSCMLKICKQKGVGDQFNATQFYSLSKLMNDPVEQVRSRFYAKLHKGLCIGIPHKCLPLDFMGFYALVGYETDTKLLSTARNYMIADVTRRVEYIQSLLMNVPADKASNQLPHIMPEYMLVFGIAVLTHNLMFTSHTNIPQLTAIKECLKFILEPLIGKGDSHSVSFYKSLLESLKNHRDALEPENEEINCRMYSICDLALILIFQGSSSYVQKDYPSQARIPSMFFKRHEDPNWKNEKVYLCEKMQESICYGPIINFSRDGPHLSAKNTRKPPKREIAEEAKQQHEEVSIDAKPTDAKQTRLEFPENSEDDETGSQRN